MQIARATTVAPSPRPEVVTLGPDDALPSDVDSTPATRFINNYRQAFFAIPGVTNYQYRPAVGDEVTLTFRTEADRQIGAMILEDVVDGARILTKLADWTGGSPLPDNSLWKHQAAVAAINALPGVWNSITWSGVWDGNGTAQFHAVNQRTVDKLDPLIRQQIVGQVREDGSTRMYDVEWRVIDPT
jgi:hypothetical protein